MRHAVRFFVLILRNKNIKVFGCLFVSILHGTPPTYPVLYWKLKVGWRPRSRVNTQQGTDERKKSSRFPFWFQISATEAETTWKWRTSKKRELDFTPLIDCSDVDKADKISVSQTTSIIDRRDNQYYCCFCCYCCVYVPLYELL